MRIATWNVNSLRVRLPQVLDWLAAREPDVLCLQETKLVDEEFPAADIEAAGYSVVYSGQKTYNGVATLSRTPATEVVTDLPALDDHQRRVLGSTISGVRVLNVYIPNGQAVGSEKFDYKLGWLAKLQDYVAAELKKHKRFVLLGDFNIAPDEEDVHDPKLWEGSVLFSEPERKAFKDLIALGLNDSFRKFEQEPASFTWWDYRAAAFRRNNGLRIDHILASGAMYDKCAACVVDKEPRRLERPSDHAPVMADFDI